MPLGSPNLFAFLALFLWLGVTVAAFMRFKPPRATLVCVLGGVMFLPEGTAIDPPLIPPIDKSSLVAFATFVGCMFTARRRITDAKPFRGIDLLFVLVLIGNIGTALTNGDPIVTGPVVRDGLVLYDALALGIKDTLSIYLPFLLGRAMMRSDKDGRELMRALVLAGIVYSFFAWLEIRLSPQLHRWIYGFHQMDFSMTQRFGGYRPMIFMITGLAVAMFMLSTTIAAFARWRAGLSKPWAAFYLTVVLVSCKSTGAIIYAVAVLPVVAYMKRPRMWLPGSLALLVLLFPLVRGFDVFPTDTLVGWAEQLSEERALSLWFRFDQEDQLLDRARERVVFGWGTYNRNRVFDQETGADTSVTDGDWMIQFGTRGVVGFFGLYGLLAFAVLIACRRIRKISSSRDRVLLGGLALISALMAVDLLPNGLFSYLPFFFAGAVHGISGGMVTAADRKRRALRKERAEKARERRGVPARA